MEVPVAPARPQPAAPRRRGSPFAANCHRGAARLGPLPSRVWRSRAGPRPGPLATGREPGEAPGSRTPPRGGATPTARPGRRSFPGRRCTASGREAPRPGPRQSRPGSPLPVLSGSKTASRHRRTSRRRTAANLPAAPIAPPRERSRPRSLDRYPRWEWGTPAAWCASRRCPRSPWRGAGLIDGPLAAASSLSVPRRGRSPRRGPSPTVLGQSLSVRIAGTRRSCRCCCDTRPRRSSYSPS